MFSLLLLRIIRIKKNKQTRGHLAFNANLEINTNFGSTIILNDDNGMHGLFCKIIKYITRLSVTFGDGNNH